MGVTSHSSDEIRDGVRYRNLTFTYNDVDNAFITRSYSAEWEDGELQFLSVRYQFSVYEGDPKNESITIINSGTKLGAQLLGQPIEWRCYFNKKMVEKETFDAIEKFWYRKAGLADDWLSSDFNKHKVQLLLDLSTPLRQSYRV